MTNKPVYKLADLKGMKLQCAGELPKLVDALGAVPVTIPYNETMTALERGTVDGSVAAPAPADTYDFQEVCDYYYALPTGTNALSILWNKNTWDSLPDDIKQIFESLREEHANFIVENYEFPDAVLVEKWLADGSLLECNSPSEADIAEMRQIAKDSVWSGWVKKMDDKGLPGQKVLDRWVELSKKYAAEDPFKGKY